MSKRVKHRVREDMASIKRVLEHKARRAAGYLPRRNRRG